MFFHRRNGAVLVVHWFAAKQRRRKKKSTHGRDDFCAADSYRSKSHLNMELQSKEETITKKTKEEMHDGIWVQRATAGDIRGVSALVDCSSLHGSLTCSCSICQASTSSHMIMNIHVMEAHRSRRTFAFDLWLVLALHKNCEWKVTATIPQCELSILFYLNRL